MLWSEWSSRYERQCGLKRFRPEVGRMITDGRLRWLSRFTGSWRLVIAADHAVVFLKPLLSTFEILLSRKA